MPALEPSKRRILIPQLAKTPPMRGLPDVRTDANTVIVTADMPSYVLSDLRWEVHPLSLAVRSADPNRGFQIVVSFATPVCDDCFIVVAKGGVWEIRMQRENPERVPLDKKSVPPV